MWVYRVDAFGSVNALRLHEEAAPSPRPNEVLVKVRASSLNYRDIHMLRDPESPLSAGAALNMVPLSDGAGEVVAVGPDVTSVQVGDRVMKTFVPRWLGGRFRLAHFRPGPGRPIDGMLAEYVVLHEDAVVAVPANLDLLEAATLPVAALTAWSAVTSYGGLKPGDAVLTLGSGGVSVFALKLAKLFGAWVAVTTSSADKAARLAALGADAVINVRDDPQWPNRVVELTGGRGVDRVIEIGGPATMSLSLRALAMGGHVCMVGFVGGAGVLDPTEITGKNIVTVQAAGSREQFEDLNRALERNDVHPTIDQIFARDDASQAYEYLASGDHIGKVVIDHEQF